MRLITLFLLLFAALPAMGQGVLVQMATESKAAPPQCLRFRADIQSELKSIPDLPSWRVVVTCDDAMWRYLRDTNHARQTRTAFTNPVAADGRALTIIHGGAWDTVADLHETLEHELKHIRCRCSLGED